MKDWQFYILLSTLHGIWYELNHNTWHLTLAFLMVFFALVFFSDREK